MDSLLFPVFDPEWRNHTKKASIAREFMRRLAFVEGIRVKAALMVVSRKLRQENFTNDNACEREKMLEIPQENFANDNTDERKRMLEKQKQLEKTV